MRFLKKYVAAIMATTLLVNMFSISTVAAETENGWKLNEEKQWNYWKNGEIIKNQKITVEDSTGTKRTYFLKDDGAMARNELIPMDDIIDEGDTQPMMYAFPQGDLAKSYWVHLDDTGQLVSSSEGADWYYFDENFKRLENTEKGIGDEGKRKVYRFDEDGKMLTQTFFEDGMDGDSTATYYYEKDGQRAENKWLNLNGDWYAFQNGGAVKKASDSNAEYVFDDGGRLISEKMPCLAVDSITVNGDTEREAEIGQEVKINFDVQLASDSNAQKQTLTKDHDFWVEMEAETTDLTNVYSQKFSWNENGTCTITYTTLVPETISFQAVIDGVSSEPVTITSNWSEGAEGDGQKQKAVLNILDNPGDDINIAVDSMKKLYSGLENNQQIKNAWADQKSQLEKLESEYMMANGITVSETTTEDAKMLLQSGSIELTGGSLNADSGETVELTVDRGEVVTLPNTYERQTTFNLSFTKNDAEVSQLDLPVIVTMPVPKGMSTEGLKVYHINSDGTPELLNAKISGTKAVFPTDSFSSYVFAGNAAGGTSGGNSSGGSGSGGGSHFTGSQSASIPETPGNWSKLDNGKWEFRKPDGSLYTNSWIYVKGNWYWMDATGLMAEGWQTIRDMRYYLTPVDGAMVKGWLSLGASWYYMDDSGVMKTGWIKVGEVWYYLGADGVLLVDTTTPDGYQVDENGSWKN